MENFKIYYEEQFISFDCKLPIFLKREKCPLEIFFKRLMKNNRYKKISVSDIFIHPFLYDKIIKQMEKWFKKYHELNNYKIKKQMSWLILDMPNQFEISKTEKHKWIKKNKIYIKNVFSECFYDYM